MLLYPISYQRNNQLKIIIRSFGCSIVFIILQFYSCHRHTPILPAEIAKDKIVLTGLDMLAADNFQIFHDKNIGLVINQTSINHRGIHIIDLLMDVDEVNIKRIFASEHGYKGTLQAGEHFDDSKDDENNIEIISLYGKSRKPTPSHMADLDAIIFDIQDVGSRYYTFVSTLTYVMSSAAENHIPVYILDRPNPINGITVQGPLMAEQYSSIVGLHPIPIRHGMTIGEIGLMINNELWLDNNQKCQLEIISMNYWDRSDYFNHTGLPWIPPSPNIPDDSTALIYNGFCLMEGTNVSEGRGTEFPFKIFGAPWINGNELAEKLTEKELPGVIFKGIQFTPVSMPGKSKWPKYEDEICSGCYLEITNYQTFDPLKSCISVLYALHQLYPDNFKFLDSGFINNLYGSTILQESVQNNVAISDIIHQWSIDNSNFFSTRQKYLLYP